MPTALESLVPERCYLLFAGRQSILGPIPSSRMSSMYAEHFVRLSFFFFTLIATFRAARGIPSYLKKKKWRWQLYWCNIRPETRFISIHLRTLIFGQEPGGKTSSHIRYRSRGISHRTALLTFQITPNHQIFGMPFDRKNFGRTGEAVVRWRWPTSHQEVHRLEMPLGVPINWAIFTLTFHKWAREHGGLNWAFQFFSSVPDSPFKTINQAARLKVISSTHKR